MKPQARGMGRGMVHGSRMRGEEREWRDLSFDPSRSARIPG
ncbi:hypothetical protein [Paraburkholderia susongensis]|nr:hypothetical protein [Paraburkholderia susongensis]